MPPSPNTRSPRCASVTERKVIKYTSIKNPPGLPYARGVELVQFLYAKRKHARKHFAFRRLYI